MAFIYRDYGAPVVATHTNNIAIKSLFGKTCSRKLVDGVEVMNMIQWYAGDNGRWGANGIRWDTNLTFVGIVRPYNSSACVSTKRSHVFVWSFSAFCNTACR